DKAATLGLRHIGFEVMDSRALRFPAGSFDAVLSGFGHPLIARGRCVEEVHRVVGDGGRFALCVWNPAKDQEKAASRLVREMLERRRPAVVATDVARLIEARKVLASTEEGKETQSAEGWIRLFRHAGLSSVETVEETHWATFRGPDAYLDYSFAWGDNEREWRHMTAEVLIPIRSIRRVMARFLRNCHIAPEDSFSKNSTRARVSEVAWTS